MNTTWSSTAGHTGWTVSHLIPVDYMRQSRLCQDCGWPLAARWHARLHAAGKPPKCRRQP